MARYKPIKAVTLTLKSYPESIQLLNLVAKKRNRPGHEVLADLIEEAAEQVEKEVAAWRPY